MASHPACLEAVLQQMGQMEITHRKVMGEYILYYRDKVIGGIYDDRFLLKAVPAVLKWMPNAVKELPYDGAKEMFRALPLEDPALWQAFLEEMYSELPAPRKKKRK